ncbi:MAG: M56 family metallopeptidase [Opitutaceae bacterium]|jgi:beta-lactamase regulating signal transducer with metallopeptidase domain
MNVLLSKLVLFQLYYSAIAAFLVCALKSTGIVALGALASIALRRRSGAARCWVWRATLVGCLALPLFDFGPSLVQRLRLAWPQTLNSENTQAFMTQAKAFHLVNDPDEIEARRKKELAEQRESLAVRPPWEATGFRAFSVTIEDLRPSPWRQIEGGLKSVWWMLAGLLVVLATTRIAVGFWRLRKNARAAEPEFQETARQIAAYLKIKRTPRVWWVSQLRSPLMVGWWTPGVYLPEGASGWDKQRREAVFLHELAHWQRGDHFWQQVGRLAGCVFWWQPLVAWAARQMNAEAEAAADDVVLIKQSAAKDYAATLVEIAAGACVGTPAAGVPMVGYRSMEKRIRGLLRDNPWRGRMGKLASAVVVILVLFSLTLASVYVGQAANERAPAAKDAVVKLTAGERASLERVLDNTLKRLAALRFLHFKLEESTMREEAGEKRINPEPTKMEAWVDEWTGIHRVEYRPRVLVWIDGAAPFSISDSTAINDGNRYIPYSEEDDVSEARPRASEGLEFYLGFQQSTDLLQVVRAMLGVSNLAGGEVHYSLSSAMCENRPVLQIREQFLRDGKVVQQKTFLVDPAEADMLLSSELVFPARNPERPILWRLQEIGRTAVGVMYPSRYQRIYYDDKSKTTLDVRMTQLEVLDALPPGITIIPKPPGGEYVAKNGSPIRYPQMTINYVHAEEPSLTVPMVAAHVRINNRDLGELRSDAQGCLIVPLPAEEIVFLDVRTKVSGFAAQIVEWRKQGDPFQLPQTYTVKLWPGSPIGGKVVDQAGQPVEKAEVRISLSGRWRTWRIFSDRFAFGAVKAITDSEGIWRLPDFPADLGGLSFRVSANGFQATTDSGTAEFRTGTGLPYSALRDGSWVLILKRGEELRGRVTDAAGVSVPKARVVVGTDIHGSNAPETATDVRGDFFMKGMKTGPITLTIEAPNQKPMSMELTLPVAEPLSIRLESGNVLRGRVVNEKGKPCAHLNVNVDTWKKLRTLDFSTQTDAEGRFVWRGAPDEPVTFVFGACQSREFLRSLPLAPKAEEQLIVMKPALKLVARVVDAITQKPIENVRLIPGQVWNGTDVLWSRESMRTYPKGEIIWESVDVGAAMAFQIEADGYESLQTKTYVANQAVVQETLQMKAKKP